MPLSSSPQHQPEKSEDVEAVRSRLIQSIDLFRNVKKIAMGGENLLTALQLKTVADEIKAVGELGVNVDDIQLSFDREAIPILERDISKALTLLGIAITKKSKEISLNLSMAEDLIGIAEDIRKRQLRAGIKTILEAMRGKTKKKGGIKDVRSAKEMESKIGRFKKTLKEYQATAVKIEAERHKKMVAEIVARVRTANEEGVDLSPVFKELGVEPPSTLK